MAVTLTMMQGPVNWVLRFKALKWCPMTLTLTGGDVEDISPLANVMKALVTKSVQRPGSSFRVGVLPPTSPNVTDDFMSGITAHLRSVVKKAAVMKVRFSLVPRHSFHSSTILDMHTCVLQLYRSRCTSSTRRWRGCELRQADRRPQTRSLTWTK